MLEAVKQDRWVLELEGDPYTNMMMRLRNHGQALTFAHGSLQKDRRLVLEAVKQDGFALQYTDESLNKDRDIVLEAVKTR